MCKVHTKTDDEQIAHFYFYKYLPIIKLSRINAQSATNSVGKISVVLRNNNAKSPFLWFKSNTRTEKIC
ncbi:MAG: hypothetical protein WC454_06570 [Phycisphaerae bacterium]